MDFVDNGRPAYHPGDLLRLFIYRYLNMIRSSRALERERRRNIELRGTWSKRTPLQTEAGHHRTQLRNNQKTVELPLHHHPKGKGQGLFGCWVHVCGL
ncbi:transposase [Pararhodonellum marinum]|uniref:transposase n=1 Tax=Pararhodonellum marinum TaxID=2755358 RepID=UPI0018908641|nr:transposase [Pararhodonellum marinum]